MKLYRNWFQLVTITVTVALFLNSGPRQFLEAESGKRLHPKAQTVVVPAGNQFDDLLRELYRQIDDENRDIQKILELKTDLAGEHKRVLADFEQQERTLKKQALNGEIFTRFEESRSLYLRRYNALMNQLEEISAAERQANGPWARLTGQRPAVDWDTLLAPTVDFLEEYLPAEPESHFDPHNLPHRSLRAEEPIPPKLTAEEWAAAFPAMDAPTKGRLSKTAGSPVNSSALAFEDDPPGPADLAETIEVQFTLPITELAASLNHNPVEIYNWVHNNIEFVPTWGSIQGAQHCLETRTCNAFDTSSLLIALLRTSGIPARYQMGTIEVPIDEFMNWAGGFTDPDAAASLFASAGTPSVVRRVDDTGRVVGVRLEHIWVIAFVDFIPSSGAVNIEGDTWIDMDPGYKQYTYLDGIDFEAVIPSMVLDPLTQIASEATVDPLTGSITGIDATAVLSLAQHLLDERIGYLQTSLPTATTGDVFGGQEVVTDTLRLLPGATAYKVLAYADSFSKIPSILQHSVSIGLGSDPFFPTITDHFNFTATLPELAGKNVLLQYPVASDMDLQMLQSSLEAYFSDTSQSLSLPTFINLKPQLRIAGQTLAVGNPQNIGSLVVLRIEFEAPTIPTPVIINVMKTGEAAALGLDLQGLSQNQIQDLADKSEALAHSFEQLDVQSVIDTAISESMLSSNILGWFALVDANNKATATSSNLVTIRYPSAGLCFIKYRLSSVFGTGISVSPDGLNMDIDRDLVVTIARDGDVSRAAEVTFAQGMFGSVAEAQVPVQTLSHDDFSLGGIASMQAIHLANEQDIPIYRINQSNASLLIPSLQIDFEDLSDIRDAINAGLEVIVPGTPVDFYGRQILGFVAKDPLSGSASFIISGGTNGAFIVAQAQLAEVQLAFIFGTLTSWAAIGLVISGPALAPLLVSVAAILFSVSVALFGASLITNLIAETSPGLFDLSPCALALKMAAGLLLVLNPAALAEGLASRLSIKVATAKELLLLFDGMIIASEAAICGN